jgi:hypothetical protein
MGKILPSFRKALIDELVDNITANSSHYYAFAANPIEFIGPVPENTEDDYSTQFENDWKMLFGKKIAPGDIAPVIDKNIWQANTVYSRYDNSDETLYENNNYYVVSVPAIIGGNYHIYKCIDNADGSPSVVDPGSVGAPTQPSTFETSDRYKWRYISSVSSSNYDKFSSKNYIPVYSNSTISASANLYSGVEIVKIINEGVGYTAYTNGTILSVQNNSVLQIGNDASENNDHYVNNSIYIYNTYETTSQLSDITGYITNSSGKYVRISPAINCSCLISGISKYLIGPKVVFDTDGERPPIAYATVNTVNHSIQNIVVLDIGSDISWANVRIQSNTSFGSGATLSAIVPPAGGHGADVVSELNVRGLAINFTFANTESNTIFSANNVYNKIGIIKNPHMLVSNVENGRISKGERYSARTFEQLLKANIGEAHDFIVGETITGTTSGAKGIVVFSNTSQVYLAGDKNFIDGEQIANNAGNIVTTLFLDANNVGDIYTKDLKPLYVKNINNVNRTNEQTETFKLTIEI